MIKIYENTKLIAFLDKSMKKIKQSKGQSITEHHFYMKKLILR